MINFNSLPKTKASEDFEKMFMLAFNPLKNHIQYGKLQSQLTEDDLHLLAHALMAGLGQWCEFLKRVDAESKNYRDNY